MITMSYEIALATGKDAANRSMRAAGRTSWSRKDYNTCWATFNRLWTVKMEKAAALAAYNALVAQG